MNRREILAGMWSASFLSAGTIARAEIPNFAATPPVQFPEGIRVPTVDEYLAQLDSMRGAQNPYREEVEKGRELLKDIPLGAKPFDVATRFHEWRRKKVGKSDQEREAYAYYAREWPVRGNPIIMGFFDATGYRTPEGDTTYWCAAFVSWCIRRSLSGDTTAEKIWPFERGAASAAYRAWGSDVEKELGKQPQPGDLAVFSRSATAGHIGFVHDVTGTTIFVLGGNQGAQNEYNGGEVNIAKYGRRSGGALKFHSFRRHECLRNT